MVIKYVVGDLFDFRGTKAHCVSVDLKMDAGIAKEFRRRYKGVEILMKQEPEIGKALFLPDADAYYLVTKRRFFHKPSYSDFEKTLQDLNTRLLNRDITRIGIPKIGCGLDRLSWSRVSNIIERVLNKIEVFVYELPGKKPSKKPGKKLSIGVAGSRGIMNYDTFKEHFDKFVQDKDIAFIVSGGAKGVDSMGERYAKEHDIQTKIFIPNWKKHGKSAGYKRNVDIVNASDEVFAMWDGVSKGTKHTIDITRKQNKICEVVRI